MEIGVAALALLLAGYALIANRLDKLSIGPALAFVAVGLVLGPVVLDVLHIDLESTTVRHLSEVTLALVLFTDASTVDLAGLRRDASLIGRLLGIGLLLTIAAGGLVGTLVFPELPLATALLIGAILAPTDAALGLPVITNPVVPIRDPTHPERREWAQRRDRHAVRVALHRVGDCRRRSGGRPSCGGAPRDRHRHRRRDRRRWRRRLPARSRRTNES